jgi:hypothetical protein
VAESCGSDQGCKNFPVIFPLTASLYRNKQQRLFPINPCREAAMPEKTPTEQIAEILGVEFLPLLDPSDVRELQKALP